MKTETLDWNAALEIVVAKTKHERYRWLCSDECPDAAAYRGTVLRLAGMAPPPAPPKSPPTPEDLALRRLVASRGGSCGG